MSPPLSLLKANDAKVLMIGGYGKLGKLLAPKILKSLPSVVLTIAGRSHSKATEFCNELSKMYPQRVNHAWVDIVDKASLKEAPAFDVLLNMLTPSKMCSSKLQPSMCSEKDTDYIKFYAKMTIQLMKFAKKRDAHYIDADGLPAAIKGVMGNVQEVVGEVKPVMLTGAGYFPGLLGMSVRLTAQQAERDCGEVNVYATSMNSPMDSGFLDDYINLILQKTSEKLIGGEWIVAEEDETHKICEKEYGTTPWHMAELEPVAKELGLNECRACTACSLDGPGGMSIVMGLYGVLCSQCICPCLTGIFKNQVKRGCATNYQADPNLCIIRCTNDKGNEVVISCPHGSFVMAANGVLAALEQILDGTIEGSKPPRQAGAVLNLEKTIESLKRQGCKLTKGKVAQLDDCSLGA